MRKGCPGDGHFCDPIPEGHYNNLAPKERQSLSQGVLPWFSLLCVFVPWWYVSSLCLCGETLLFTAERGETASGDWVG